MYSPVWTGLHVWTQLAIWHFTGYSEVDQFEPERLQWINQHDIVELDVSMHNPAAFKWLSAWAIWKVQAIMLHHFIFSYRLLVQRVKQVDIPAGQLVESLSEGEVWKIVPSWMQREICPGTQTPGNGVLCHWNPGTTEQGCICCGPVHSVSSE